MVSINALVLLFAWTTIALPIIDTDVGLSVMSTLDNIKNQLTPGQDPSSHTISVSSPRAYLNLLPDLRAINDDLGAIVKSLDAYKDTTSRPALTAAIQKATKSIRTFTARIKKEKKASIGNEDGELVKKLVSSGAGYYKYHTRNILTASKKKQSLIVDNYREYLRDVLILNLRNATKDIRGELCRLMSDIYIIDDIYDLLGYAMSDLTETRRALAVIRT